MIQFEQEESHIRMKIIRGGSPVKIDMHLRKNKTKGIAINGVPIRKASELFGVANFVFFSPEDLNIIKNWSRRTAKICRYGALSVEQSLYA